MHINYVKYYFYKICINNAPHSYSTTIPCILNANMISHLKSKQQMQNKNAFDMSEHFQVTIIVSHTY